MLRCSRHHRQLLVLVVVVLLLVSWLPEVAHAQRAAVSLGARLKNRWTSARNQHNNKNGNNGADDIIQGEPRRPTRMSYFSVRWWDNNGRLKASGAAFLPAAATLLLMALGYLYTIFSKIKKKQRDDAEGEFFAHHTEIRRNICIRCVTYCIAIAL